MLVNLAYDLRSDEQLKPVLAPADGYVIERIERRP
jgi:hypothetical protein